MDDEVSEASASRCKNLPTASSSKPPPAPGVAESELESVPCKYHVASEPFSTRNLLQQVET